MEPRDSLSRSLLRAMQACTRGEYLEAMPHVRRAMRLLPERPDLWAFLGDLQLREELYGPSATSFRRALALLAGGVLPLVPELPSGRRITEAAVLCGLGSALAGTDATEEAESALRRAAELEPSATHCTALGDHLELTGRRAEAKEAFHAALKDEPGHVDALYRLGCWHMWTEPRTAVDYFRRVLLRDSQHGSAMSALGHLLTERGEEEEGLRWLRRAVRTPSAGAQPHVYLGHDAWRHGRADDAEKAYRAGMRADPGDAHPWFALGDLHVDLGRREGARRAYEEALRVDPGSGDAMLRLARLHDADGREVEATECFRRGLEMAPNHPWRESVEARLGEAG